MPTPEKGGHWGILGGTFDPIHCGHLTLVHDIQRKKPLDGVLLIPAHKHPFKKEQAVASWDDRLAMLRLAIPKQEPIHVCEIEREQNLSGYTLDTVRAVKERYLDVTFYFLVGADNIAQISTWHKPEEILDELTVIAGTRPKFSPQQTAGPLAARIEYIETTPLDISSSAIRNMISGGATREELIEWLDPPVYDYILKKGLYR